jgi:hypothetical protein
LKIFCAACTDVGDCAIPRPRATLHHRGVSKWQLHRVTPRGRPAANQPWPGAARRQVRITRLGAYTRVVLLAAEAGHSDKAAAISTQSWA